MWGAHWGGYDILSKIVPSLNYTGIDISPNLIIEARKLRTKGEFKIFDGTQLPGCVED
jgi:hypothetical protein